MNSSARRRAQQLRRRRSRRSGPGGEDRALISLVICGVVFVLLVAVKLLFPEAVSGLTKSAGELLGRNADFKEAFAAVGRAEAEAIRAKALAEAEGIDKKAEAMKKYGEAAVIEMVMQALPQIAKNVAEPLSKVDKITRYGDGNSAKLLEDIINGTSQVTEGISQSMGIDIKSLVAGMLGGKLAGGEDKTIIIQSPPPSDQAEPPAAGPFNAP